MKLDSIDLKILQALQKEGRLKSHELAERVALSPSPCLARVHRLEAAGIITGYRAEIDITKIAPRFEVLSEITLFQQGNHRQSNFVLRISEIPALLELLEISGRSDYIARFGCRSLDEYQRLVDALIQAPSLGIATVTSHIVMREVMPKRGYDFGTLLREDDEQTGG